VYTFFFNTALIFLSLLGFIVIAIIVSFDVAGLTIAKSNNLRTTKDRFYWAGLNGIWHAGLLAIYALVITGALNGLSVYFSWVTLFANWVEGLSLPFDVPRAIRAVALFLQDHTQIIAGVIGIAVIWWTYSSKIVDVPSEGDSDQLPLLARTVYRIFMSSVRLITFKKVPEYSLKRFFRRNAEAALVAVDMLALALLAKNLGLMDSFGSISAFASIVFVAVSIICFWVALATRQQPIDKVQIIKGPKSSNELYVHSKAINQKWWMVTLRLMEPWLIFYFSLELISYLLFGKQVHSIGFLFGASLMLVPLVKTHGLDAIIDSVVKTQKIYQDGKEELEQSASSAEMKASEILILFKSLIQLVLILTGIFIFLVLIWYFYKPIDDTPSLDSLIGVLGGLIAFLSIPIVYLSPKWKALIGRLFDWCCENRLAFNFTMIAIVVAALSPIFEQITLIETGNVDRVIREQCAYFRLGIVRNHSHAAQVIVLLLAGILVISILNKIRNKEGKPEEKEFGLWEELAMSNRNGAFARALLFIFGILLVTIFINEGLNNLYNTYEESRPAICETTL